MATPLLTTKLYIPPTRPELISRPRLIERLNAGLHQKLTLISAPAGFGKTTLLSEWINQYPTPNPPNSLGSRWTKATTTRPASWPTLSPPCRLLKAMLGKEHWPRFNPLVRSTSNRF